MCSYSYGNIDAVELKTRSIHLGIGIRHAGKHSEPLFYLPFAVLLVGMARLSSIVTFSLFCLFD